MQLTTHSFNPFRSDFEHKLNVKEKDYGNIRSVKGRLICLVKFTLSPVTILFKIAKKIFRLVAAVFTMLAELLHFVPGYGPRLLKCFLEVIDRSASFICSPLNILVARIRYLLGIIHPEIVFSRL